jgi:mRNA deadenylase 3'-5' endonuclease subunit Ccr4
MGDPRLLRQAEPVTAFDTLFVYNASWPSLNVANQNVIPEFKIYPNPTQDFITIENTATDQIQALTLLDYSGKMIKRFYPKNSILNLRDLSPGIYLLQISTIEGVYCEKIRLE